MSSSNSAIIAAAGSGKTDELATRALQVPRDERVALVTFTVNGAKELASRIASKAGYIPPNITVSPWFSFLLRHAIRPYQNPSFGVNRISPGLHVEKPPQFRRKDNPRAFYLNSKMQVYSEVASDLAMHLNEVSGGAVFTRLSEIFSHFMFDEIQDISGRDFEVIEAILKSPISVTLVGDPRQATFSTTRSGANKKYTKSKVVLWLEEQASADLIQIEYLAHSMRCNQEICSFADSIYPDHPATTSRSSHVTDHEGVFLVRASEVHEYITAHSPQLLVYDSRSKTYGYQARNMGDVKGLTFDRVILELTGGMKDHFTKGGDLAEITRAKLYVGITRARFSVAMIIDDPGSSQLAYWR